VKKQSKSYTRLSLLGHPIRILLLMDAVIFWLENPMQHDTARLVHGLHGGDPEVLDSLIELYQHRLFRYLLSITGSRPSAQDLFQETWLRVLERGRQYRSQWKFEVWLFSIARHLVIDEARRKKGTSLQELMDPEAGTGFQPVADGPSPFEEMSAGEEGQRMSRFLSRIPAGYREVLALRFQDELALEEIATVVHAPLSTVKSRLYRGLEALRRLMEVEQT
jgi:RNA polymerase sigma-70 factor, ECF subfamily